MPENPTPHVSNIDELKRALGALFQRRDICFTDIGDYAVRFVLPGEADALRAALQGRTTHCCWDGGACDWFCGCREENWLLYLKTTRRSVLCLASVLTRHERYLDRFRSTLGTSPLMHRH
jgi:hypothetical protein